jgi:hypothetical protein
MAEQSIDIITLAEKHAADIDQRVADGERHARQEVGKAILESGSPFARQRAVNSLLTGRRLPVAPAQAAPFIAEKLRAVVSEQQANLIASDWSINRASIVDGKIEIGVLQPTHEMADPESVNEVDPFGRAWRTAAETFLEGDFRYYDPVAAYHLLFGQPTPQQEIQRRRDLVRDLRERDKIERAEAQKRIAREQEIARRLEQWKKTGAMHALAASLTDKKERNLVEKIAGALLKPVEPIGEPTQAWLELHGYSSLDPEAK